MAAPAARHSTEADLDALDRVCERLAGFDVDVNAEYLDGYLAAVVAGPRVVPADEWRAALLQDDFDRVFADPEDRAAALATLAAREAVLRSQLDGERIDADPDHAHLVPLLLAYEGDDAPRLGSLWSLGFQDAMSDFDDDWAPPASLHDEDRRGFEGMLAAVRAPAMADAELAMYVASVWPGADDAPTRDDLIDSMCFAVQDLRLFWADHAPRPVTRRVEPVPGRNDACPCGSGLKYKRCHGKP